MGGSGVGLHYLISQVLQVVFGVYPLTRNATQSYGLTAEVAAEGNGENISDGIALTGFTSAPQFVPYFLYGGQFVSAPTLPALQASYANGYLAAGSESAVQSNFFAPGTFEPEMLALAMQTGQPVTVGELLTLAAPASAPNGYAGPVLVVTGGEFLTTLFF